MSKTRKTSPWIKREKSIATCSRCGATSTYVAGIVWRWGEKVNYWKWWNGFKKWHKYECPE